MPSTHAVISYRSWGLALCAAGALLSATVAVAADRGNLSDAQMVYQRDRAACINGQTSQDRANLPAGSRRCAPGGQAWAPRERSGPVRTKSTAPLR